MLSLENMRIGFAGTPEFAAVIFAALLKAGSQIVVAYSQPDRPAGRGRKLTPSPVKLRAQAAGIRLCQPRSLRGEAALKQLASFNLDLLVVAAYGLILPPKILATPNLGCINVHASLLPRWRGAAPIERAIMAGDNASGVCIMRMEAGLDTGPVFAQATVPISINTTGRELHDTLGCLGATTLLATLTKLDALTPTAQEEAGSTYADKLSNSDTALNWDRSAATLARQINALNDRLPVRVKLHGETIQLLRAVPVVAAHSDNLSDKKKTAAPGTIVSLTKDSLIVTCGSGSLSISEVKLSRGKARVMPIRAVRNGYPKLFAAGSRFDSQSSGAPA